MAQVDDAQGNPLNPGRKTRAIPPAMRRALEARDVGCRFPGCTNTRFTDAHHIIHWADGGKTSLDNLVLLCRRHHRYLHEHGYTIARTGAALSFASPGGEVVHDVPRQPDRCGATAVAELINHHAATGLCIDETTTTPDWQGEDADYNWLVALLQGRERDAVERC